MVLAYYFLNLQTNYEGRRYYYEQHYQSDHLQFTPLTTQKIGDSSLLPPKLDKNLLLDDVSEKYPDGERRGCDSSSRHQSRRCPVSWLIEASPAANSVNETMDYFRPYMTATPQEWEWFNQGGRRRPRFGFTPVLESDKNLKGHEGPGTNRTMTMTFDYRKDQRNIQSLTIFYLQKHHEKWKGTEMTASVYSLNNQARVAQARVSNYHETIQKDDKAKATMAFDPPQQHFQVEFKHTGGMTFRMTGLAIC